MRRARKLASMLLILALATGLMPVFPAASLASEPPTYALGAQLHDLTGTISVRYLSANKKTRLVALLLDTPIRVAMAGDGGAAQTRELSSLALNTSPSYDKRRVKVSGTLVSSAALALPDPALAPCALDPVSIILFRAARTVTIGNKVTLLPLNATHQLSCTIRPASAEQGAIWASSNPAVLAVDETGKLSANAVGRATITARARSGKKATLKLSVEILPESVALDKTLLSLLKGSSMVLQASVSPQNATNKGVRWTSSDDRIAKVSSAGKVTARRSGAATITATAKRGGEKASCLVIVQPLSGGHQPVIELDGLSLQLPFTKAEAQAALKGWTSTGQAGGFTRMSSAKHPNTTLHFDQTGALYWISSTDPHALITSQRLTVGSTLREVIDRGGTAAWHSAWAGSERFCYALLSAKVHDIPLVIDMLLVNDTVHRIEIYASLFPLVLDQ